jgi:hypothetical protein
MKRLVAVCLLVTLSLPVFAVGGDQVRYVGGTVSALNPGGTGRLDATSDASLIFEYSGKKLTIPYADIQSFEYSKEVARHLGVLPAIIAALLKTRQRRHFFRISYHGQNQVAQVIILEVPKQMPRILQGVLRERAGHAGDPCSQGNHAGLAPSPAL